MRRRALNLGEEGREWLRGLDGVVASLGLDWGIELGAVMSGASEAFVAEAVLADGTRAVLKVGVPGSDSGGQEARVLEAAQGQAYARIFRSDGPRRAMLIERLGRRLADLGLPIEQQMRVICGTLLTAWRPVPAGLTLMNGAEKAESLGVFIEELWGEFPGACSDRVIERALAYARLRRDAFDPEKAVLAHGDPHAANTLQAGGPVAAGFRFIDPDGLLIEPAYDLAISMRDWSAPLLVGDALALGRERAVFLGSLTGVDPRPIWEWGFIERVSTGLLIKQLGGESEAAEMLAVAEAWAVEPLT